MLDLPFGMHVGKNIGTAEGINRLFRITDDIKPALRILLIQSRKDLILQRVGILKLINHRDRILLTDTSRQHFTSL